MTDRRERRVNQTIDLLNTWAGIGVFGRLAIIFLAIAVFIWCINTIAVGLGWLIVLLG